MPEGRIIIPQFSVKENLLIEAYIAGKKTVSGNLERNIDLFPILKNRINKSAGIMSEGEQQILVIEYASMSNPKILLLEEPSLELALVLMNKVMEMVKLINESQDVTIVLVEQNSYATLELADRG